MMDHPRSRGVYAPFPAHFPTHWGSSPLARGLLLSCHNIPYRHWIIPARAGFTLKSVHLTPQNRDHPRSRGVYGHDTGRGGNIRGSSPLARGLPQITFQLFWDERIIPARAGFTFLSLTRSPNPQDHPRSRGVYRCSSSCSRAIEGSSPLARGLPQRRRGPLQEQGIIPARAGFTRPHGRIRRGQGDHPRSRGVYSIIRRRVPSGTGSSPLARGLLKRPLRLASLAGIIPARAGFTAPSQAPRARRPDHPRSRGVYNHITPPNPRFMGSSPLARGLRPVPVDINAEERIIPARAGFTLADP